MFTATLLANPQKADLTQAALEALRRDWAGDDALWLNPGIAAEFSMAALPPDRWLQWQALQAQGIDLVVQKSAGRKKKLLLADMDSTMIEQECIDELAALAGVGTEVAAITRRAMRGELDFANALRERLALLRGLSESAVERVLQERISFMPGGAILLATMRRDGAYAALVSSGFTAFTRHVATHLGFDEHRANTLLIENGRLTGVAADPILDGEAKLQALETLTIRLGLTPEEVMAVGDGANDLGMLKRAGAGVALHAKPAVAAECDIRIHHGDLTALLYIQGYASRDFQCPKRFAEDRSDAVISGSVPASDGSV